MLLQSSYGTVVFGTGTFVLHKWNAGAPPLTAEGAGERTVEIEGYILPAGESEAARGEAMERAKRLLCRTVADPGGFTLRDGARELHLTARTAPAFAAEAPFGGTDAARFVLIAHTEEDGAFRGEECGYTGRALEGRLVFPLGITEKTVLASLADSGTLTVENPGDLPCGFTARITAEGGSVEKISLSLGGDTVTAEHPLSDGESLTVDTQPGHKGVFAGGVSVMEDVAWDSVFFSLMPGENRIRWKSEGFGHAVMRLTFLPRYL